MFYAIFQFCAQVKFESLDGYWIAAEYSALPSQELIILQNIKTNIV